MLHHLAVRWMKCGLVDARRTLPARMPCANYVLFQYDNAPILGGVLWDYLRYSLQCHINKTCTLPSVLVMYSSQTLCSFWLTLFTDSVVMMNFFSVAFFMVKQICMKILFSLTVCNIWSQIQNLYGQIYNFSFTVQIHTYFYNLPKPAWPCTLTFCFTASQLKPVWVQWSIWFQSAISSTLFNIHMYCVVVSLAMTD
jgi:hypothetical protein